MEIKKNTQNKPNRPQAGKSVHKIILGAYVFIFAFALLVYFLLKRHIINFPAYHELFSGIALAIASIALLMFLARIAENMILHKVHHKSGGYNIIRFIRLLTFLIACVLAISFLNANWYTAAVSLGLISLILGFALQTPIASLIGWFYIIIRTPYRVGDRIQVGAFTGDVVEINYVDTTLWEFAGDYMSNDLPSGRLIRFPNSMIFSSEVYNYSWNKFPYIWNEIPFHVAYESDLPFIDATIRLVARDQLGPEMEEKVNQLRAIIEETPVDELEIKEYPFVQFRTNANTWVEVLLVYLVEPKQAGAVRSQLIKNILAELLNHPDKVLFPKSNNR